MNHEDNCKKPGMSRGDFLRVVGAGVCCGIAFTRRRSGIGGDAGQERFENPAEIRRRHRPGFSHPRKPTRHRREKEEGTDLLGSP